MGHDARLRALILVAALSGAGCARTTRAPLLGIGPFRPGDPTLYDDAIAAARDAGHPAVRTDPERGLFAVRAASDPMRRTYFVVQCSRDGFLTITPQSPDIVRTGDSFTLSRELRDEYGELVLALERSIPETR